MDTPFHRVLLSGLVYARARLTIGPCFNRRSGSQPASRPAASPHLVWVFYVDIIDFVLLSVLLSPILRRAKRPDATPDNARRMLRMESDLFVRRMLSLPMKLITALRQCLSPNARCRRMQSVCTLMKAKISDEHKSK